MESGSQRSIDSLIQQGYSLDIGRSISRGWEILKQNMGPFIGYFVIVFLISVVLGFVFNDLRVVANLITLIIGGPLNAGFFIVAFKIMKRQSTSFDDFFRGFNNFLPLSLTNILVSIVTLIGFILLIIPGIYLAVAYCFAIPLVVDKKMQPWEAMETSRKLITKQWFTFFILGIVLLLINIVGAIPAGLGLLITVPLSYCTIAAAYESVVGLPMTSAATPDITDTI